MSILSLLNKNRPRDANKDGDKKEQPGTKPKDPPKPSRANMGISGLWDRCHMVGTVCEIEQQGKSAVWNDG